MATTTRTTFSRQGAVLSVEQVPVSDDAVNQDALRTRAEAALATNVAFLAIAAPTNAQVLTQTKVLTRECSALIRLMLSLLDTTDGS